MSALSNPQRKVRSLHFWPKFEGWWEVIRAGLIWLGFLGLTILAFLTLFIFVHWVRTFLFEEADQTISVVITTLFVLPLLNLLKSSARTLVDNLFFRDTATFQDTIDQAIQELSGMDDRDKLQQFLTEILPDRLRIESISLYKQTIAGAETNLSLPLIMGNRALGHLVIGPKRSGRSFGYEEKIALRSLQEQVSLVLSAMQLADIRQEAENVAQMKSNFLTNVSHELWTPLNVVINSTGLVADGILGEISDEQRNFLNRAVQGSEYLLNLLSEILDITKIESGQLTLRVGEVDLKQILNEALPVVESMLQNKPVVVRLDLEETLPLLIADRQRVRQILLNILSNAAKFTREGYILIRMWSEGEKQVFVSVEDTGIGIAKENLPYIFEDFHQFSSQSREELKLERRRHVGTGLGMSITKALVELHGGRIWVESEPGLGSTFSFILPRVARAELIGQ